MPQVVEKVNTPLNPGSEEFSRQLNYKYRIEEDLTGFRALLDRLLPKDQTPEGLPTKSPIKLPVNFMGELMTAYKFIEVDRQRFLDLLAVAYRAELPESYGNKGLRSASVSVSSPLPFSTAVVDESHLV